MKLSLFALAVAYLGFINIKTYRAFAADKRFAINKEPRTPEATLLHLARLGGWVGAKLAQKRLRHKSYKQPFGRDLNVIGAVQAASVITFVLASGILALAASAPASTTVTLLAKPSENALPDTKPAAAVLEKSLRPPAARR